MEHQGHTLARCVDMFVLPAAVIYAGTGQKFDPTLELLDADKPRLQHYWMQLLELRPSLEIHLRGLNMQGYMNLSVELRAGYNLAKAHDALSITRAVVGWLEKDLQAANVRLERSCRSKRGFNNVVTGSYLCPIFLDYGDQTVREALLHGIPATAAGGPPSFLFDLEEYDSEAPWRSFLRGPLIVLAWFKIFDYWGLQNGGHNMPRTHISVARSLGMTEVTIGSVIYAATMVHFALSTTGSLSSKFSEVRTVHEALVEFVHDPDHCDIVEGLLQWWNGYEFQYEQFTPDA